ncbi:uncharacterized protein LOC128558297 [Mercenaria mercenaria]|uniref:uncharacterized protein LOC128558297 n=1 Tax=Mercenaria mercenaria TaxID=6596 RepID=UPI00234F611D|nr:uncharacterized protein LOC128558297 [Mercenaria mercenaria]
MVLVLFGNAVGKITQLERRLVPQNDNCDAPSPRPLEANVRNAAGLDARDAAAGQLSSDSDDDEEDAPLPAPQPLAVQQPTRQLVAPQLAAPQQVARQPVVSQQAAGQPVAPQPVVPQQPTPQPASPQLPVPNRRRRRIPLAELIRENHSLSIFHPK